MDFIEGFYTILTKILIYINFHVLQFPFNLRYYMCDSKKEIILIYRGLTNKNSVLLTQTLKQENIPYYEAACHSNMRPWYLELYYCYYYYFDFQKSFVHTCTIQILKRDESKAREIFRGLSLQEHFVPDQPQKSRFKRWWTRWFIRD